MATEQVKTYCRFCHAYCPMVATVEDNRLIAIGPDTDNEIYGGYTCVKGRQMLEQIYHPGRLTQSQKRTDDGSFVPIASQRSSITPANVPAPNPAANATIRTGSSTLRIT
mgnify:CR=1 FL=1